MAENQTSVKEKHSTQDLVFVLLIVLLICGGNGISLVVGAILWKLTGSMIPGVAAVVGITILFFSLGMILVALRHQEIARQAREAAATAKEKEDPLS